MTSLKSFREELTQEELAVCLDSLPGIPSHPTPIYYTPQKSNLS